MAQKKLPISTKRTVKVKGKSVTFSQKTLKDGSIAYYRGGKRAKTPYQERIARGVLGGKTVQEARGKPVGEKPFGDFSSKRLKQKDIVPREADHMNKWAEAPSPKRKTVAEYYARVSVSSKSLKQRGSPTGDGEAACKAVTLRLGLHTYREMAAQTQRIISQALTSLRLEGCTGRLQDDVLEIWRKQEA